MSEVVGSSQLVRAVFLASFTAGLPAENIEWASRLSRAMTDVYLKEGDVAYHRGDLANEQFFIVSGEMKLEGPGKPTVLMGEGAIIGTVDITLERARIRSATAVRPTHLLRLAASDWLDLLEDHFEFIRRALSGISHDIRDLHFSMGNLDYGRAVPHRFADERSMPGSTAPLDLVERVLLLREVELFSRADVQSLTTLAELAHEVELAPGESLHTHHGANEALVVLISGQVHVTHPDLAASALYRGGELVLGVQASSATDLGYSARSATHTRALRIAHEDYFDMMEEHFSLSMSSMKALAAEREMLMDERGLQTERQNTAAMAEAPPTQTPIDNARQVR